MRQPTKTFLAGGVLALALFGPAIAGPLEEGVTAYQNGDYAEALRLWRPLANQGNAIAQAHLGLMYTFGRGVPKNDAEAVAWLRKAAAQGNSEGEGRLGVMYLYGEGVPQDYAQAHMWLRKGAEQGDFVAQDSLGYLYETGKDVPQDYVQAHMWYNLAASDAQDAAMSDTASQQRDLVAAKMTPAQIAEAQRMAREWVPRR
jgi:uncharacterized protein